MRTSSSAVHAWANGRGRRVERWFLTTRAEADDQHHRPVFDHPRARAAEHAPATTAALGAALPFPDAAALAPARRRAGGGVLGTATASYVGALTFPGDASWQVRTVEWVRDHGGGGLVDVAENWWYAHNRPTGAAPAPSSLPAPAAAGAAVVAASAHPPPLRVLAGAAPLPGEAVWQPSVQRVRGIPPLYHGYFRPDPAYPSLVVGVAWLDQSLTSTTLIAGTREPGGTWPEGARVPTGLRLSLLAAFNSGWKLAGHQRWLLRGRPHRATPAERGRLPRHRHGRSGHRRAVGAGRLDEPAGGRGTAEPRAGRRRRQAGGRADGQRRRRVGELEEPVPVHLALRAGRRRLREPPLRRGGPADPGRAGPGDGRGGRAARHGAGHPPGDGHVQPVPPGGRRAVRPGGDQAPAGHDEIRRPLPRSPTNGTSSPSPSARSRRRGSAGRGEHPGGSAPWRCGSRRPCW